MQQWQVVRIPGLLPIILHRTYQSTSAASGLFGPKWTDEWSRCLRIDNDKIIFKDSDGAQFDFIAKENTVRSRNTHAPHYLLTGSKNESLTIFDSIQQHTLSFAHIDGDYRRLSAITDRNQNSIHFIYNDTHQLVEIRRNDGFLLELEYQKGQLQRIIGGKQKHEQHVFAVCAYDPQGYLSECEAYQQNHLWHRYTTDGLMVQWGDTDQTELTLTYDDKGRVITTHSSSGYWHDRFIYDDTQRMTTYIDGEGGYSRYYYNEDNLVTRVIDPLWRETHTQWKQRQKISEINSLGEKTEYGYHFDGQLAYLFLPDGRHVYYDYNELGQLISYTSPSGEKWLLDYDTQGNLTTLTDPQGHIQAYEYSQHGELLKAIHPNGAQWQYEYNSTHQLIKTKNPYQNSTEYQFDELGRLQEYTDALKHTTRYHYSQEHASENGSVSDILLPDGVHQHIEYDSERRVVAVTDGEGKITRYRYGPFDLLLAMVRPDGTEVRFEYDSLTRLKAVINATGDKYTYERDRAGQIIRETDFTGRVQEHRYDQLGRRIATRYPDQHELRWRYDVSGLVVEQSEWLDNGVENKCLSTTTYEYNARLQLVKATNPDSVVEFEYDAQGRLTCERINGQEIKHDWDSDHSTLTRTTFGDRELHYAFGQLGELTSLQINQHAPLEFGYNAVGQEYLRRSEAGFVNSSHYTATGLLAHQRAGRGSENFLQSLQQNPQQPPFCTDVHRSYQYDRAHNVVRIEDDRWKQTTYRYNANDQITETQYSNQIGNRDEKFLYDANLNLTEHMTLPSDAKGAMLQLFQQQQAGRVTRRDTARGYQLYHYDVNGRLEKKVVYEHGYRPKEWRYLWNTQNQLTACFTPKGDCWRYTYDAFGRRLSKTQTVDSQAAHINPLFPQLKPKVTAWHYLWSGDQMVEETPIYADGTIAYDSQVQWLYEPGAITPTARYQNGKLHYVVTDHQGTPREIFTEAGKASWAGRLNTWGQMQFWQSRDGLADNDPTYTECHFRFAGQYEDRETGLYYNRFRYYDKDSGQYISPDPIGLLGGFNPYGYVHCPTGWVDPFGLAKEPIIFLPDGGDVLHPKTVSAQNPEGLFTIKATGSYADDKLALYKAAGIDEYPSRKWISHHVSYNPATNEMTMQLVNPEYHSHPHVGGAHQFEEKTGHKYGTQDAIDEATKRNSAILNCKPGGIKR
ncbi:RHS repeat-associated core domain-containing protein [Providencia rettgeri]|uniref:RHS repeat-associated core domain-containing protein n=1 Tax=Providencia rettgeri TaxID=587 RepID=UPI00300FA9C3